MKRVSLDRIFAKIGRAPQTVGNKIGSLEGRRAPLTTRLRRCALRFAPLAVAIILSGCPRGGDKPPTAMPQIGAFRHEEHLAEGLGCDACHVAVPELQYALKRPGTNAHAPCDGCHVHEKDFYSEPGPLCEVCHVSVDPLKKGNSPLKEYPQVKNTAQLVAEFNHKQHLSKEVATSSIAQLDCKDCHQVKSKEDAYASFPDHRACARCHLETTAPPHMKDCNACHQADGAGRSRKFLRHLENDVRFTHGKHQVAPTGEAVECRYCHEQVDSSVEVQDLNLPEMRVCSTCHDSELTPVDKRMKNCGLCHTDDVSSQPLPGDHTASILQKEADKVALTMWNGPR